VQTTGNLCGALLKVGFDCIKNPMREAMPAFLGPPQTFVRLQIDAALRADLLEFIKTILIYNTNIIFY
jgi:hypothetical protein